MRISDWSSDVCSSDLETRARVSAAARELGYVVDRHASSLRLKSSETIALVTVCRPGGDRSAINPFYFALLGSIAAATSARGFTLLVSFQESAPNFRADFVVSGRPDARTVSATPTHDARKTSVKEKGVHVCEYTGGGRD